MNISLTPDQEKRVQDRVATGDFDSPDAVVEKALDVFEAYHEKREALQAELQKGIDASDQGDVVEWDIEAFLKEAHTRHAAKQSGQT